MEAFNAACRENPNFSSLCLKLNQAPTAARRETPASREPSDGVSDEKRRQVQEAINRCSQASSSTESSCSTDRANGMSGTFFDGADAFARSLGTTNMGAGEACQNMAQTSSAANSAMLGVKSACVGAYQQCSDACSGAERLINELPSGQRSEFQSQLRPLKTQCQSAQTRIQGIDQNLARIQQSQQQAQNCQNDVTGNNNGLTQAQLLQACAQNPNLPQCATLRQDCSNPQFAASNQVCICVANPTAPGCGSGKLPSLATQNGGDATSGSNASSALSSSSLGGLDDMGSTGAMANPEIEPSASGETGIRSRGGDSAAFSGSAHGANTAGLKYEEDEKNFNTDVLSGRYAGGGTSFGAAPDSPVGSYSQSGSWIPPKVGTYESKVDLNKFRPDMQMRNPASDSVPSGLLASHVNIWRQMNKRYLSVMGTLKP